MTDALDRAAQTCLSAEIMRRNRLHGGDLSDVFHLTLTDNQEVVAKVGARAATEARMLKAIRAAGAPAPEILGLDGKVLFLESLHEVAATNETWEALGQGLRLLHTAMGPHYGWAEDYAFETVAIPNAPKSNWIDFWIDNRLLAAPEAIPPEITHRLEMLAKRLPDLMPATPQASLLHGDLWTGNALFAPAKAYLIDPASYYGHAEVDLAMLCLFGAPPPAFWSGYGPTEPDLFERRPLYQLWPALVHLRLFGASYRSMVESHLAALSA